jgi:5-methylcytosine-specific restriction endonuclease McrA
MTPKNSGLAYKFSDEAFTKIILSSDSCITAMKSLGFTCVAGNARKTVKRRINELNISTEHWLDTTKNAHIASEIPHDEYFAKNTYHNGGHTRKRILKYKLFPYKCAICGNIGEWFGLPLTLQIDHINGDHTDNSLENLRFLCPNCHSQTVTFAGKNKTIKN